ncbi:hypothetical protein HYT23_00315 [Candidatus Pacearchaeota archaeon]|nr:hypothetical protein [Candidatus Pacearchaeota archaeon]
MEKKGLFLLVLFFLFFIVPNFISAVDTIVQIETYPNKKLEINFLKPSPLENLYTARVNSDALGKAEVKFSTTERTFDINAFVKDGTEVLVRYRFNENTPGENVLLKLYTDKQEIVKGIELASNTTANETVQNETEEQQNDTTVNESITEEETESQGSGLTGLATSDDVGVFSGNKLYYILGGAVLVIIIAFVIFKIKKKNSWKGPGDFRVKKLSDPAGEKEKAANYSKALAEAERKVEEAQREIRRMKNQDRITEMRKRIDKEQEELKKLERGEH